MRIAFDGRTITGNKSGIGVYSISLLKGLIDADKNNDYKVFVFEKPFDAPHNLKFITTKISCERHPKGDLWESIFLPYFLIKEKVDIFHSPTFHQPIFMPKVRRIATIHDLTLLKFPQTYPQSFVTYGRLMIRLAIKTADAIIVPSKNTKKDILEIFKVKPDKVYVVPSGVREGLNFIINKNYLANIRIRYNLPDNFILFVSTIEPRKNLEGLVRAYSKIRRKDIEHKLVICGAKGWLQEYERINKIIEELGITKEVFFIGHVPDEDIAGVYNLAALFVYPSFYEGFGFPPLEAMACGCPVITSNTSSLPEVVGDAAILIDPFDIEGLAEAIYRVLSDGNLKACIREAGLKRAGQFSWKKAAMDTIEVYKKA